jgi:hypothetical protein
VGKYPIIPRRQIVDGKQYFIVHTPKFLTVSQRDAGIAYIVASFAMRQAQADCS